MKVWVSDGYKGSAKIYVCDKCGVWFVARGDDVEVACHEHGTPMRYIADVDVVEGGVRVKKCGPALIVE